MPLPPRLDGEVQDLRAAGFQVDLKEDPDFINLVLNEFPLGEGYSAPLTVLLLRIPRTYPEAGPDMFWVDPSITLASGQIPQAAEASSNILAGHGEGFLGTVNRGLGIRRLTICQAILNSSDAG